LFSEIRNRPQEASILEQQKRAIRG
jgi:hypothetical protein